MDKKLKAKWLRALKSGEYGKGEDRLLTKKGEPDDFFGDTKTHDRFCCIAVYYEIAGIRYPRDSRLSPLDGSAESALGVTEDHIARLININDRTKTFTPVIEYIEKNL